MEIFKNIAVHVKDMTEAYEIAELLEENNLRPSHPWYDNYKDAFQGMAHYRNNIQSGVMVIHPHPLKFSSISYMKEEEFKKELYTKLITFEEYKKLIKQATEI